MPFYVSITDSPIHELSFRPIPMIVDALTLKLWVVQNGASEEMVETCTVLDDPPFQREGTCDHGDRAK